MSRYRYTPSELRPASLRPRYPSTTPVNTTPMTTPATDSGVEHPPKPTTEEQTQSKGTKRKRSPNIRDPDHNQSNSESEGYEADDENSGRCVRPKYEVDDEESEAELDYDDNGVDKVNGKDAVSRMRIVAKNVSCRMGMKVSESEKGEDLEAESEEVSEEDPEEESEEISEEDPDEDLKGDV